jgi:hypothetical protein
MNCNNWVFSRVANRKIGSAITINSDPKQVPSTLSPEITLQYLPEGRPVGKVDENDL